MAANKRIESLDILRGLVMLLMALDHVRDYTHFGYWYGSPTNLETTTGFLFFTRWITHFCAPVFVFLAGTAAFLFGKKQKNLKSLSRFLWTRGIWLVFIELTVVNFAWTFDPNLEIHIFQVIWAIGVCMVLLGWLVYLPQKALLTIGLCILFGHNLLDDIVMEGNDPLSLLWYFIHQRQQVVIQNGAGSLFIGYPLLPWLGIMILGYCFGYFYKSETAAGMRKKWLLRFGFAAIFLFVVIRYFNIYGDMTPWSTQKSIGFSILSFLNTTKYPPSLMYTLMTLGPALLFLYAMESVKNACTRFLVVIGRVPFFYYILHLYLAHVLGFIGLTLMGESWTELIFTTEKLNSGYLADKGFDLWVSYAVWIVVVLLLYPLCKWFMQYKAHHKNKWWLRYL